MYGTKKLRLNLNSFEMISQTTKEKLGYFEDGIEVDTDLTFPNTLELPASFIRIDGNIVLDSDEKLTLKEIISEDLMIIGEKQFYFNAHRLLSCTLIESNRTCDLFQLKMISGNKITMVINNSLTNGWINNFSMI